MGRYAYTQEQNEWLAGHYPSMTNRELAEAFAAKLRELEPKLRAAKKNAP